MKLKNLICRFLTVAMTLALVLPVNVFAEGNDDETIVEPGTTVTPEITWKRSKEVKYSEKNPDLSGLARGVSYKGSNGPVWTWNDVSSLKIPITGEDSVWDYNKSNQYGNITTGSNATGATWCNWTKRSNSSRDYNYYDQHASTSYATARKFTGTFEWPEGYDLKDVGKLISVNDDMYKDVYDAVEKNDNLKSLYGGKTVIPVNDDMYVFIHDENTILNEENYMDYMVFWSGTINQNGAVSYKTKTGTQAFNNTMPDGKTKLNVNMNHTDNWYTFADTNGVSSVLANNYKEGIQAGTKMVIDIIAFDYCGSGGMDKMNFQLTKRDATAETITVKYYLDTVNDAGYLGESTMNNVMSGTAVTLPNGTDASQLNYLKAAAIDKAESMVTDGEQQTVPYIVRQDKENVINVVYTTGEKLATKSFVIDYAKEVTFSENDVFNDELTKLGGNNTISLKDNGDNSLVNSVEGQWGQMSVNNNNSLTYKLKKIISGIDTYYLNVANTIGNNTANLQKQINVIPANNVYYEDDFVTDTSTGTVGIEYTGSWIEEGTKLSNKETINDIHGGWTNSSLADDTGYSDGSAHVSSTSGATASFTFTGTGVDIYSRTNQKTGTIYVTVKNTKDGTTTTKRTVVDNQANSGDYYQIPTYTFSGDYGTYEVTVRVTTGAASEKRYTYYLDGIRVYNPIKSLENDQVVKDAYTANELDAVFTEVRGLLDADSGVAFIDEDANGNIVSKNYLDIDVAELAPEHEVYLASGQSIVFAVNKQNAKCFVGLKAPKGATSVAFSNDKDAAQTTIGHSTDLYYSVTPNDGKIVIKNTGDNLLSITKLKATNATIDETTSTASLVSYAKAFNASLNNVETVEPDQVEIQNPEESQPNDTIKNTISNIFNSVKKWFKR